jgi:hypothetical protein
VKAAALIKHERQAAAYQQVMDMRPTREVSEPHSSVAVGSEVDPDKRSRVWAQEIIEVIAATIQRVPKPIRATVITMVYSAMAKAYAKADMGHQKGESPNE